MKVGILTFHRANNLGAVLQAYALQKHIENQGLDCELIDYYPNNAIPGKLASLRELAHKAKYMMRGETGRSELRREKLFSDFRSRYFMLSKAHYYGDQEIEANPPQYDLYISGSDQILNTTLTGKSRAYYLSFVENGKKVSYASSFGRESISEDEKELIGRELASFDCISARESTGVNIIKEFCGRDAELVLDPVFLLDKLAWGSIANKNLKKPEKYIFVYSMENSESLEQAVEALKKESDLPVLVVRGGGNPGRISGKEISSCGPLEFLGYIKDAEYVVTNSFHGSAFSIIMGKNFYCVAHSSRNTRLENLLELIGTKNKQIVNCGCSLTDSLIIGNEVNQILKSSINKSKAYINTVINRGI